MKMTTAILQAHLDRLDDGVLRYGAHKPGREFCALEFKSQVDELEWTDNPYTLQFPDIRPLNDLFPPSADRERTAALLPLMAALWDWKEWTPEKRKVWVTRVAIRTVNLLIAELPGLNEELRENCRAARTLDAARSAVEDVAAVWNIDNGSPAHHVIYTLNAIAENYVQSAVGYASTAAAHAAYGRRVATFAVKVGQIACQLWAEACEDD